ncbi:MAG: Ig-like domain-containing protein [Nannocystaceae bacterium]
MTRLLSIFLPLVLAPMILLSPSPAQACSCGIAVHLFPEHGAVDVPTNTKIWLYGSLEDYGDLNDDSSYLATLEPEPQIVSGQVFSLAEQLQVFVPNEPLKPGLHYRITVWGGFRGSEETSQFTVGQEEDGTMPERPAFDSCFALMLPSIRRNSGTEGGWGWAGISP